MWIVREWRSLWLSENQLLFIRTDSESCRIFCRSIQSRSSLQEQNSQCGPCKLSMQLVWYIRFFQSNSVRWQAAWYLLCLGSYFSTSWFRITITQTAHINTERKNSVPSVIGNESVDTQLLQWIPTILDVYHILYCQCWSSIIEFYGRLSERDQTLVVRLGAVTSTSPILKQFLISCKEVLQIQVFSEKVRNQRSNSSLVLAV